MRPQTMIAVYQCYFNDGLGNFGAITPLFAGGYDDMVTTDFNGDNFSDIAVASGYTDNVSVIVADGFGGFVATTNYAVGDDPSGIALGDFNNDNILDLVAANESLAQSVSVLLGNGDGTFGTAVNIGHDFSSDFTETGF